MGLKQNERENLSPPAKTLKAPFEEPFVVSFDKLGELTYSIHVDTLDDWSPDFRIYIPSVHSGVHLRYVESNLTFKNTPRFTFVQEFFSPGNYKVIIVARKEDGSLVRWTGVLRV